MPTFIQLTAFGEDEGQRIFLPVESILSVLDATAGTLVTVTERNSRGGNVSFTVQESYDEVVRMINTTT